MKPIFLVSGPLVAGKSMFTEQLTLRFDAKRVSTRALLLRASDSDDRDELIKLSDKLDVETNGKWVLAQFLAETNGAAADRIWLVDAVRTLDQVRHFRDKFGDRVIHVHLTAPIGVLRERYLARKAEIREFNSYDEAREQGATESNVEALADVADIVLETHRSSPRSLLAQATAGLGLFPREVARCVDVLVGAQYGSEGKGNICAFIAKDYDVLMRVGGPNAGHKVAYPKYDYIQLPSGTQSNPDAKILIGAGATLSVKQVLKEIADLKLTEDRLSIDSQAIIIEDSDIEREAGTLEVIGSTKKGVGVATARKILGRDGNEYWGSKVRLAKHVTEFKPFIRDTKAELEKAYAAGKSVLLEGTQGTDLSLHHGEYPFVTSRETTASGCLADAGIAPTRVRRVIMVMRTYPIRVGGRSGPMMNEITVEDIAERSDIPAADLHKIEVGTVSGKERRIAEFDWEQVRRAASINGVTDIALTFADYLGIDNRKAKTLEELNATTRDFIKRVEKVTNARVSLISKDFGKDAVIIDRRQWN